MAKSDKEHAEQLLGMAVKDQEALDRPETIKKTLALVTHVQGIVGRMP